MIYGNRDRDINHIRTRGNHTCYGMGIDLNSRFIVAGSQDEYGCPEFDNLWDHEKRPDIPAINYDKAETDMVRVCAEFCRSTLRWVRSCWSVPACSLLPALFNEQWICRCSVGAPCSITLIPLWCIGTTTATFNELPAA